MLTHAMLEAVADMLHLILKLPPSLTFDLACALTRRLHGNVLADQLGIKKTWVSLCMPLLTGANKLQRAWDRRNPSARQQAIARTIKSFQQNSAIGGETTYQQQSHHLAHSHLPQTKG